VYSNIFDKYAETIETKEKPVKLSAEIQEPFQHVADI